MPRKRPPPTVLGSKNRLDELKALRHVLARRIDDETVAARDLAPLVRQLREVRVELDELEAVVAEKAAGVITTADDDWSRHLRSI
ncbi:hypothetical protein M3C58_00370 [Brachybacterium muris]|uniref:hypothetical protein n=1 Tax=Brachybacterium muris TaxID=219301 RepID=UPI0021A89DDD|nr:hypothetical protein [Brachybacterium muris]MCT1996672.1 hypothetical protein [Brachybacterium muris]